MSTSDLIALLGVFVTAVGVWVSWKPSKKENQDKSEFKLSHKKESGSKALKILKEALDEIKDEKVLREVINDDKISWVDKKRKWKKSKGISDYTGVGNIKAYINYDKKIDKAEDLRRKLQEKYLK